MNAIGRGKCRNCSFELDWRSESQQTSEEAFGSEFWSKEVGLTPRVVAAFWFAAAAFVPVWFFYSGGFYGTLIRDTFRFLWPFGAMPILCAAFCGFLFGAKILDPLIVDNGYSAAWRGIKTSGISFILFVGHFALFSAFAAVTNHNGSAADFLYAFAAGLFVFAFFGSLAVGWLVLIIGALGGYLLFLVSRLPLLRGLLEGPRIERRSIKTITIALMSLFLLSWIPYLIARYKGNETWIDQKKNEERYEKGHPPTNTNRQMPR